MKIKKRIKLDFARSLNPIVVYAKQGDINSRFVEIEPLENGVAWEIPAGVSAKFACRKPDGKQILNDYPTIKNNIITVELTNQTLTADGEGLATVILFDDANGSILSTQNFILNIEKNPLVGAQVESSDEYQSYLSALLGIEDAFKQSTEAVEKATQAVEDAETAVNTANDAAEIAETAADAAIEAANNANEAAENVSADVAKLAENFTEAGSGNNKCNPNTLNVGQLNNQTGIVDESATSFLTSDFIEIPNDVLYIIVSNSANSNIGYNRICFYDNEKKIISGTYSGTTAVSIPENSAFVRVTNSASFPLIYCGFNNDGIYNGFEKFIDSKLKEEKLPENVAKKEDLEDFEKNVYLQISENFPVKPSNTTFFDISTSTNLQDSQEKEIGRLVNGIVDTGATSYATFPYAKIYGNDGKYVVPESKNGSISWNAYAFYDSDKKFISGNNYSGTTAILIPTGAYYIRVSTGQSTTEIFVGVNDTGEAMPYEKYYCVETIKPEHIDLGEIEDSILKNWYKNKKATALGDSITANGSTYTTEDGRTGSAWREFVAKELELSGTIYNCGVGGSKVSGNDASNPSMWTDERIGAIPTDSDIIFFNGGMNDWGGSVELGTIDSFDTNTFYGALNTIVKKLYALFPTKLIVFMTTTFGVSSVAGNTDPVNGKMVNSKGLTQYDYGRCIKEVAEKNGIPCIDLHALCGWNKYNIATYVNTEGSEENGLTWIHPNREGGKKITTAILSFLKNYQPFETE